MDQAYAESWAGPIRLNPPRPPAWLIASKLLLGGLLLTGALFTDIGGFAGKGMAYRLPFFLAPALVVPLLWRRRGGAYPVPLDAALTLPFLFDTLGNAFGLYDRFPRTDDILHCVNWFVLVAGVTLTFAEKAGSTRTPRWLLWVAGAGFGAMAAIVWEAAEYAVMRAGVGGLSLTYGDTITDLVLSTTGGAIGALVALRATDSVTIGSSGAP